MIIFLPPGILDDLALLFMWCYVWKVARMLGTKYLLLLQFLWYPIKKMNLSISNYM